jgi:DNA end-binding protein Ku
MSRAMWKGSIALGELRVGVKLYSAVEDRSIRFRMLHKKDHAPVEQHIIRKDTGADVDRADIRKAFALDKQTAVILQPEDLEKLAPPDSRDIPISRFVTREVLGDQWYDRPYYLGPDEDEPSYFALARAITETNLIGIARWVMRKKRYVGALTAIDGYLALVTLRRADQVLEFAGIEPSPSSAPRPNELKLAEQLVTAIQSDFDPALWQNEYRPRLQALIEAKARGKQLPQMKVKKKVREVNLADSLKASIAAAREKKVA